jgi:hypothetical protein
VQFLGLIVGSLVVKSAVVEGPVVDGRVVGPVVDEKAVVEGAAVASGFTSTGGSNVVSTLSPVIFPLEITFFRVDCSCEAFTTGASGSITI